MGRYVAPLVRWWWLILLSLILAGVSSFLAVSRQPPVYEVLSTLVIGRSFSNPNPNSGEIYLEQQLATVYANLGSRETVATATMKTLSLSALPTYYVRTVPNTPLIEIVVSDIDAARAVAVANELANQLIQSSPSGKEQLDQDRQTFIDDQLTKIQAQIKTTESDITTAQEKLGNLTSARQIADIQTQITSLQQKLMSLQNNYSNLITSTQGGSVNTLAVVQAAEMPSGPVGPNRATYIILAAALGLVFSSAAAYGLEFIDNSFKSAEEVAQELKVPILGYIPTITSHSNHWTYASHFPRSPVADAFRILRTNLEFTAVSKPLHSILIAGPDLSMGKSVIATNLALIFSQGEKKVVLVDADLRRPKLNIALDIEQKAGITDICLERTKFLESLTPWQNGKYEESTSRALKGSDESASENNPLIGITPAKPLLHFMSAGTIPPNPAELLASSKFDQLLKDLIKFSDIVVLDSPPLFLPDASILLGKVDGVILVIELGRTSKKSVRMSIDQINRSGANFLGIILNRVGNSETYYANYRPYS